MANLKPFEQIPLTFPSCWYNLIGGSVACLYEVVPMIGSSLQPEQLFPVKEGAPLLPSLKRGMMAGCIINHIISEILTHGSESFPTNEVEKQDNFFNNFGSLANSEKSVLQCSRSIKDSNKTLNF